MAKFLKKIMFFCFFVLAFELNANAQEYNSFNLSQSLADCSESAPCLLTESALFFPLFPWFQYPLDTSPTNTQIRKFERFSAEADVLMSKTNNNFSGYRGRLSAYYRYFGLTANYMTLFNGDIDQSYYSIMLNFRLKPKLHFQPFVGIGWKSIVTDTHSGSGLNISFFNYKISLTRRVNLEIANYIAWLNGGWIDVEGVIGIEYYVYPTISLKTIVDVEQVFSDLLYGGSWALALSFSFSCFKFRGSY
jgi:hypothetical protein